MKKIILFLVSILLLSNTALAQESKAYNPCDIKNEEFNYVYFCPQDLYGEVSYSIFGKTIKDNDLSNIFYQYEYLDEQKKLNYESSIVATIIEYIYKGLTILFLSVVVPFFFISFAYIIFRFASGKENSIKPVIDNLIAAFLIWPVGGISLGILLVIFASTLGGPIANAITAYTIKLQTFFSDSSSESVFTYINATEDSKELTKIFLANERTNRAIIQSNIGEINKDTQMKESALSNVYQFARSKVTSYEDGSKYLKDTNFWSAEEQFKNCFGTKAVATKTSSNYFSDIMLDEIQSYSIEGVGHCNFDGVSRMGPDGESKTNFGDAPEKYGNPYSTGLIGYQDTLLRDSEQTSLGGEYYDVVSENVNSEAESIVNKFRMLNFTSSVTSSLEEIVESGLETDEEIRKQVNSTVIPNVKEKIKSLITQKVKNFRNKISGYSADKREQLEETFINSMMTIVVKASQGGFDNGNIYIDGSYSNSGFEYLLNNYSKESAKYLNASHCYRNIKDYQELGVLINKGYENTEEDYEDFQNNLGTKNAECLSFNIEADGKATIEFIGTEFDSDERASFKTYVNEQNVFKAGTSVVSEEYSAELANKAKKKQAVVSLYFYTIRQSAKEALSEIRFNLQDRDATQAIINKGFLGVFSHFYSAGPKSSNAANAIDSIDSILSVSSENFLEDGYNGYVNIKAFYDVESSTETIDVQFNETNVEYFFSSLNDAVADINRQSAIKTKESIQMGYMEQFQRTLTTLLQQPIRPILDMFGAEEGQTISERIAECGISCGLTGDTKHVYVSAPETGYRLFEVGSMFILLDAFFDGVEEGVGNSIDDSIDNATDNKSVKKGAKLFKKFGGLLIKIGYSIIEVLIEALAMLGWLCIVSAIFFIASVIFPLLFKVIPLIAEMILNIIIGTLAIMSLSVRLVTSTDNDLRATFKQLYDIFGSTIMYPILISIMTVVIYFLTHIVVMLTLTISFGIFDYFGGGNIINEIFWTLITYLIAGLLVLIVVMKVANLMSQGIHLVFNFMNINVSFKMGDDDSFIIRMISATGATQATTSVLNAGSKVIRDTTRESILLKKITDKKIRAMIEKKKSEKMKTGGTKEYETGDEDRFDKKEEDKE